MEIRKIIKEISGFKFMINSLNILSSPGRRLLYDLPFINNEIDLKNVMIENQFMFKLINSESNDSVISKLSHKLSEVRDIENTIKLLANGIVLNDIYLFEIKGFALIAETVRSIMEQLKLNFIKIPELESVVNILDPENKRIPYFYIYDSYSEKLAKIREEIKLKQKDKSCEEELVKLLTESEDLETEIRIDLSKQLRVYADDLATALYEIARLDILLAKALLAKKYNLVQPQISDNNIWNIKGMKNPEIDEILQKKGKFFQAVDIEIFQNPTVITGANMTGKSVILKTVALIQFLAQFGFFVPADSAEITLVNDIFLLIGDGQDEMSGLSSFAAEMMKIDEVVRTSKTDENILVLIDEPARTTNPDEGQAIVCGIIQFLQKRNIASLITTHYTLKIDCRNLRVKGIAEDSFSEITSSNINDYVDYSLEEMTSDISVPHEALRIAEILGVDKDLIIEINKQIKKK